MTTYTPTIWQDNDDITAVKLNKIEDRIQEIKNILEKRIQIINDNENYLGGGQDNEI